ncbi:pyridoxamine 5'-phosphate oxidase family protein [Ensifer sp.]|uniref:pyridoxamine 5'-phosphate oxidase family protein n=1 Tax=Ensifer sp. TaxID=1872086 RepID=UPI000DD53179|nr:pyridoxamine 5'-phosphate oxidase family protein [Ensifer sp.]
MFVRELSREECIGLVSSNHIGRLACARNDQPYVVPIQYAYSTNRLYGFSMPGRKVDWMRTNPRVCVEVDELAGRESWKSAVIYGRYRELADTREGHDEHMHAWSLLEKRTNWWEPGGLKPVEEGVAAASHHLFFVIDIDEMTGRAAGEDRVDLASH